ncbi:MAG: energy transducer TonB [Phenylobacterium sp.]|uniref:energy transducer TonB n=1 Tax=Phenylobacterium sp. TaxID=1871053 RepID=UPI002734AAB9|nr:energy transducer TonB [Phenylobacterium sp.]MDP3749803.1 energy transducer TonB [Phenylobacterium sp.]
MRHLAAALACALLLGVPARADEELDVKPDWLKRPTPESLMSVWPREALQRGLGGKAVISCSVSLQGALRDCSVVSESPAGSGFGVAAIALTPQLLMKPGMRGGKPVVSTVRIPINFEGAGPALGSRLTGAGSGPLMRMVLSNVTWRQAPTYAEVVAVYPEKAKAREAGGRATLNCTFKAGGLVGSCDTITEEPKGMGFAAAARTLSSRFVGPETLKDGRPTKGVDVQIPFVFAVDMLNPASRTIGKPQWTSLPDGQDMVAGYPAAAVEAGVRTGRVVMNCQVVAEGRLSACATEREEPAGLGFGDSAVALSKAFRVQTWSTEGLPTVGGSIRVPLRYEMPNAPPAKP